MMTAATIGGLPLRFTIRLRIEFFPTSAFRMRIVQSMRKRFQVLRYPAVCA
jgi:hypothetical protein